jgi:hypothetical protein
MMAEPRLLRTSERATYKRCRQQWAWTFIDGYRSTQKRPALEFGEMAHAALAAYYPPGRKRGPHPAATFKELYAAETREAFSMRGEDEEWLDAGELGIAVLEHYVQHWGRDRHIEIIAPEHPFKIALKDVGGSPFYYVGRFDALGYDHDLGEYFVFEHKTASSIPSGVHLALDEQAGSYWAFAPQVIRRMIRAGTIPIRHHKLGLDHILYNYLRKAKPPDKEMDEDGHVLTKKGAVSKRQPANFFERIPVYRDRGDMKTMIKRIRQEAWEMRMVREGKIPIFKNPSGGYPDRHCEACPFRDMCELHETRSDWRGYAMQNFVHGDAYTEYMEDLFGRKEVNNGHENKTRTRITK